MSVEQHTIQDYLANRDQYFLVDVRSEGEFAQGHIPGAVNISILNNEERKIVGTIYKQLGNQKAVIKGFELAGPKFSLMVKQVIKLAKEKPVMVYCWRGGMRSEIFAWLLQTARLPVFRIKGGYKKYRSMTFETVRKNYHFIVLGGKTGCGKTEILHNMNAHDFQVVDIEALANHKGSVFGGINMPEQPTNEQFENVLAETLWKFDPEKPIWIENENQLIGKVILPAEIISRIKVAPLVNVVLDDEKRLKRLINEYANLPRQELIDATKKLEKRLGNLRMRQVIAAIGNNEPETWVGLLMEYYDKGYDHNLFKTEQSRIYNLEISGLDHSGMLDKMKMMETEIDTVWKQLN